MGNLYILAQQKVERLKQNGDKVVQNVTSIYPSPHIPFPIGEPMILKRTLWVLEMQESALSTLYHGCCLKKDEKSGKITFALTSMIGTWTHMKLWLAKRKMVSYWWGVYAPLSSVLYQSVPQVHCYINSPIRKWGFHHSEQFFYQNYHGS